MLENITGCTNTMNHLKMIKRITNNEKVFNAKFKRLIKKTNRILANAERQKNKLIRDFKATYEYEYQKTHCIECGSIQDLQDIQFSSSKLCLECSFPIDIGDAETHDLTEEVTNSNEE